MGYPKQQLRKTSDTTSLFFGYLCICKSVISMFCNYSVIMVWYSVDWYSHIDICKKRARMGPTFSSPIVLCLPSPVLQATFTIFILPMDRTHIRAWKAGTKCFSEHTLHTTTSKTQWVNSTNSSSYSYNV
jgi:hypothetical protein